MNRSDRKQIRTGWIAVSGLFVIGLLAGCIQKESVTISAVHKKVLEERLRPVGTICLHGDPCAQAIPQTSSLSADEKKTPAQLYRIGCAACHDTGIGDAPKIGDRRIWRQRRRSGGIEQLYSSAINGLNTMPARGLCVGCTDQQLRDVVDYIVSKSR